MSKLRDSMRDGITLLRYLPAIYQEDEASRAFLERFLSIFGSKLQESEDVISNVPIFFDPLSTPEEFLPWLAGWLALDLYERMGERNREFILNAVQLCKWKGTARGLKALVETLTDRRCEIKEAEKKIFKSLSKEAFSDRESLSLSVDTKKELSKMDLSKMGTVEDEVHYTLDTNPDRLNSRKTVGIFVLLEGDEGFLDNSDEYKDQFQRIIESFLPVFVRAEIYIKSIEAPRRSHPTSLIVESWKDEISNYMDLMSYRESTDAKEGGLSNSLDYRSCFRFPAPN